MNSSLVDQTHLPTAVPTPRQLAFQDWEMGLFLHFGIRTFYEGHKDWDGKPMPVERFNPSSLDCDQWIVTAKRAGMNYAVLVAKHHDGFANWPSAHSSYTVAQAPWRQGTGDVVREFTDACRRHDMKVGLYYSPAEWGNPTFDNAKAYDDHFIHQISELLSDYGAIDILWFDGCGSENHQYDWRRIIGCIRSLQPEILIFNMGDPDFRWVGNEAGIANLPNWNTVKGLRLSVNTEGEDDAADRPLWLPAECDCMMRWFSWFFGQADQHTVKPVEELVGLYYLSVGRGANLMLNIGPDRRGLLPDADRNALVAFGAEIRRRFAQPLATFGDGKITATGWEYARHEPFYLDHVVIEEDLIHGEHIRRFALHIQTSISNRLITMYEGRNIGHRAICRFPLVAAVRVIVEITASDGPAMLRSVTVHNTTGLIHQH